MNNSQFAKVDNYRSEPLFINTSLLKIKRKYNLFPEQKEIDVKF